MESTKILSNGRRLPTPILFGLNFPAVVQIQLSELQQGMLDENMDKRQVSDTVLTKVGKGTKYFNYNFECSYLQLLEGKGSAVLHFSYNPSELLFHIF